MTLSAAEQFLLELINRGRLDPGAEAALMGIDLNQGLAAGTISTAAKQVLAPNALLEAAATGHTLWMLAEDTFSHTGEDGSQPEDRMGDQGYTGLTGENIAFMGSTGPMTVAGAIEQLNENLFHSAGHRVNMMLGSYREVGLGAETGPYTQGTTTFNAAMLTENFGSTGNAHFLTGVAYQDSDSDRFYSMGEGLAGVTFAVGGNQTATAAAGGYALGLAPGAAVAVTGQAGGVSFALSVDLRPGNVKLDLVNGSEFYTSGSVVLGSGVQDVRLLGVGRIDATGTAADNGLTGNAGANRLSGLAGRDVLFGAAGADVLTGGGNNDRLTGGKGADDFVFALGAGRDRISDFSVAGRDELHLDDRLWGPQVLTAAQVVAQFATVGAGEVLFDFGAVEIRLAGLTTLTGLAAQIEIF